jgi:5-methylcytosine-specific restriction endonuclease McrBC GTP-binding regulatory subunit McrB
MKLNKTQDEAKQSTRHRMKPNKTQDTGWSQTKHKTQDEAKQNTRHKPTQKTKMSNMDRTKTWRSNPGVREGLWKCDYVLILEIMH